MIPPGSSVLMSLTSSSCYLDSKSSVNPLISELIQLSKLYYCSRLTPLLKALMYIFTGIAHSPLKLSGQFWSYHLSSPPSSFAHPLELPVVSLSVNSTAVYLDAQYSMIWKASVILSLLSSSTSNQSLKPVVSFFLILSMDSFKMLSLPSASNLWTFIPILSAFVPASSSEMSLLLFKVSPLHVP